MCRFKPLAGSTVSNLHQELREKVASSLSTHEWKFAPLGNTFTNKDKTRVVVETYPDLVGIVMVLSPED